LHTRKKGKTRKTGKKGKEGLEVSGQQRQIGRAGRRVWLANL
jgi:hypothetical protein